MSDTLSNLTTLAVLGALGIGAYAVYRFFTGQGGTSVNSLGSPGCERSWICNALSVGCPSSDCLGGNFGGVQPQTGGVNSNYSGTSDQWAALVNTWLITHPDSPVQPIAGEPGWYIHPLGKLLPGGIIGPISGGN